ncbi:metal-dependent membrane protease [Levilactobacillus senmaizukei DSM 21775 = NBRC 103853]|uniref:Metal-dependent membrane protease n=1 Tax=Levilactobacillus senmaizukei DSM 21775 = NBRC 103853 TaxID=1423803 RepID=A0A0R2DQH1_9LACO|nr:metal-dependent membrane protease [Levilactobacillus senmaizukei DSM 21775 = NBRC 103853]
MGSATLTMLVRLDNKKGRNEQLKTKLWKIGGFSGWGWVMILLVLLNFVQLPTMFLKQGSTWQLVGWCVLYIVGFVLTAFIGFWAWRHFRPRPWQRLTGKDWWLMVRAYGFILLVEAVLGIVNSLLYHETSTANNQAISQIMGRSSLTMIMLSITVVLASPVVEELTFRGVLLDGCFSQKSFWLPVMISGAVFSIPHMSDNPVSWVIYAVMGGTFAYVYRKTDKLQSTIILHAFNNLIAVGLMLLSLKIK